MRQAVIGNAAASGSHHQQGEECILKRLVPGLVIGALVLGTSAVYAQEGSTLSAVQARGQLVCGVNGGLPGMSVLNQDTGVFEGMDADYCRALAAAVLGDANAVQYLSITADQRATAIQGGEVDVIFRNTTNTLSRDAAWGDFGPTIFYDGQGMMVRAEVGATSLEDLAGATICVTAGTTTELNLTDQMAFLGVAFEPVVAAEIDTVYGTYEEGRCDAVTSDKSQLVGRRSSFANPDDHVILDVTMSKEPLAPVVATGDNQWADIVRWVVNATIEAEELGITSENVGEFVGSDNPVVARLLGEIDDLGSALGLSNDFVVNVISAVGNYGEIYDRAFGPGSGLDLAREGTLNDLWTRGGLMYAPPFR
jgi:general L-amino acid transport system substrate-binding protein